MNWQEKIKYLCKRYNINAALASETLAQLDQHNRLTVDQLATLCDKNEATHQETKYFD